VNAFASGIGIDKFMNQAFNFNSLLTIAPSSGLGAGIIIQPGREPSDAVISVAAVDAEGQPGVPGFETAFERGTIYFSESRVKTDLFDHTGHQSIGYLYSNKQYTSLNQTPANSSAMTSGTWLMYYNFDQFLYETAEGSGKGWGAFGRFGVSDGNPNKIKYFWSLGLGAVKGAIEARPDDTFGIGLYNSIISKTTQASAQGLKNEWGVEGYYNVALTPWAYLSPDIQYVIGANPSRPALVLGTRLKVDF
jgi:porin